MKCGSISKRALKRIMTHRYPALIVADPSLSDPRGHHFALSLQISRGARLLGVETSWLTHKDFAPPNWLDEKIYPVFSVTMYDRYREETKHNIHDDPSGRLYEELMEGISKTGANQHDHLFFHTGFGDIYRAVGNYYISTRSKWSDKPFLHVCTPYDIETMPGKDSVGEVEEVFKKLKYREAVDKKVFFWAETPQLSLHYSLNYGINVRNLPLPPPIELLSEENQKSVAKENKNEVFTALYLGAAREEKGFLALPEIVSRLYDPYGKEKKLRFVIQCSPQIVGYLPQIKSAIEALSAFPEEYVELVDSVLDREDYIGYLRNSDVVLLLYNRKSYRIRGSGIAVEALCANSCVITYKNTFCEYLVTDQEEGVVDNEEQAIRVLGNMIENRDRYREQGRRQGERYRKANSIEIYIKNIISQVNLFDMRLCSPCAIVGHVSPLLISMKNRGSTKGS